MLDIEKVKIAYDNASFFKHFDVNYSIELRQSQNINNETTQKSLQSIDNIAKFWSKDYTYDTPIVIVSTDENGYDFLLDELKKLNFSDAMPNKKRFEHNSRGIFGSGGYSIIEDKVVLLYWQVINSKVPFEHTGDLKNAPHLFTHSIQTVLAAQKFNNPGQSSFLTDFPGWYVEGQADFAALVSMSNTFEEYLNHRENYFKYAFVPQAPGGEAPDGITKGSAKINLKNKSIEEWQNSLKHSPLKFAGIPLSDEYYTGLLAYEEMMYHLSHEEMMLLAERFVKGESFADVFNYFIGKDLNSFYDNLGQELFELAKTIHVSSWPSWKKEAVNG